MIKPILSNGSGYLLRLANGQGWHLMATEGVKLWVGKLASIMELERYCGNGYPKLIFVRGVTDKERHGEPSPYSHPNMMGQLPKVGWKAHKFPPVQIWSHFAVPDVICEIGNKESHKLDIVRMLLALYPILQRAQDSGALSLHAALLERNGIGVLLIASSEIGKSTCCIRLCSPWRPLCDDETLVVRNHQKQYLAHPFPTWSDYLMKRSNRTWNIEYHLPLSAILFLEQAKSDEVFPIGQGEAAVYLNNSATQMCYRTLSYLDHQETRSLKMKLFENACELAKTIPAFKLRVSLVGRFWEKIEEVLP